mmetsp:Transcript_24121/g.78494  ORF Transcript_24121/g.78494 Transcript_24121/m.78494 type:complete len:570 (+) Transcript_24121:2239-3948(+)
MPSGERRAAVVRKTVLPDGSSFTVGLEVPIPEPGEHTLNVSVCPVEEDGSVGLPFFEPQDVTCTVEAPRLPLPRLQQKDALVLCGVDIPKEVSDGKLRVIVALKRVWNDAPREIALIVRDLQPDGVRRAAVVYRTLGDDAEAVGLEVPLGEAGAHVLTVQVAKVVNGEMEEVFRLDDNVVYVSNPPPSVVVEDENLAVCGVDVPEHVDQGTFRGIVALQRKRAAAPENIALIVRDILPDGTSRVAVVRKQFVDNELKTIGIEVPMNEAGDHLVEICVAESTPYGNFEIFRFPPRKVSVSNPPMPRIAEKDSVVLCGIDIHGARWPNLKSNVVNNGRLQVIMAIARTWEDAPNKFALVVRDVTDPNEVRKAAVFKTSEDLEPFTIGLHVPLAEEGRRLLEVEVAAVVEGGLEKLFSVQQIAIDVIAPAVEEAAVEEESGSEDVVSSVDSCSETTEEAVLVQPEFKERVACKKSVLPLKATFSSQDADSVIRRLSVPVELDEEEVPVEGFSAVTDALVYAFRNELKMGCDDVKISYTDEDGDEVMISCDEELGLAMQQFRDASVMRVKLHA